MEITTDLIKQLREETSISVGECKKALEEAKGDMDKAREILRIKSGAIAQKKGDRTLGSGVVSSYIHNTGGIGCMLTLLSETDFVAKNKEFSALAYEIALHCTAMNPQYIKRENISEEEMGKIKQMFEEEIKDKPAEMRDKILEGKIDSHLKMSVLLEQPFVKDDKKTIKDLLDEAVQKFGERIEIGEFIVYKIG